MAYVYESEYRLTLREIEFHQCTKKNRESYTVWPDKRDTGRVFGSEKRIFPFAYIRRDAGQSKRIFWFLFIIYCKLITYAEHHPHFPCMCLSPYSAIRRERDCTIAHKLGDALPGVLQPSRSSRFFRIVPVIAAAACYGKDHHFF
jgi:hypothetical protein